MTYEEMRTALDTILEEGEAAAVKAEEVLGLVPSDDIIIGELHAVVMAAGDEFAAAKDDARTGFEEIIAAASKFRNATLAWANYAEAVAANPSKSTPGLMDAIFARLQTRGLIIDSGLRRWSEKKGRDDVVWVIAPGVSAEYDAGSSEANAVLRFIRERSAPVSEVASPSRVPLEPAGREPR